MKDKLKKLCEGIWNVPNVLTMFSIALIPVFVILYVNSMPKAALVVFLAASFTDYLDGYLARKLNQITAFGKLMDPLADKIMVITALLCQTIGGVIPWAAFIIVSLKEILMVLGGMFMLGKDVVVYSNMMGKVAQCFFIAALTLSFFHAEFAAISFQLDIIILWISVVLTLLALVGYALRAVKTLKKA